MSFANPAYTVRRISYNDRKERQLWPNGARMAMLFYTCPEEWEWDKLEVQQPLGVLSLPGERLPSASTRTAVQYGFHVGLPRIFDIVEDQDIKITLATTGNAAVRHGDLLMPFIEAGHEIAAHGYSEGVAQSLLATRDERARDIDMTLKAIFDATGYRARGWWGPGASCSDETVELLAERGMLYHGDLQDDDLPYLIDYNGNTMVQIPYNMVVNVNDYTLFTQKWRHSVDDHVKYVTSSFDAYYEQAAKTPLFMIYGTHPFVTGRPEGAKVLAALIAHAKKHEDVWIATYSEVAEWWKSQEFT